MDKKSAFFIILSIAILAVMLYFIGIDKVIDAIKDANLAILGVAILIQIGTYFLYTYRWQIVNNIADINIGFRKLFPIVMVGLAVNNITPSGRGGGEPVRAYILQGHRSKNVSISEVITIPFFLASMMVG